MDLSIKCQKSKRAAHSVFLRIVINFKRSNDFFNVKRKERQKEGRIEWLTQKYDGRTRLETFEKQAVSLQTETRSQKMKKYIRLKRALQVNYANLIWSHSTKVSLIRLK